jgi:uroporphyrinogen decarboxylase
MAEAMTSREIVRRCIEFDDPPRIGLHFRVRPLRGRTWDVTDFALLEYGPDPAAPAAGGVDEWGLRWESTDPTGEDMGQVKGHPLAEGWEAMDRWRCPDFSTPARYAGLGEAVAERHAAGKYVYGHVPSLMTLPGELRGLENWFADHVEHPGDLGRLLDLLVKARLDIIDHYARAGVDGVISWDDMGAHDRPLVSPRMFREIYLPRYRRTCDALHERGMHFIHHCCGQVRPYVPMFVEAGCDVLQLDQPTLMGIDWLAEQAGGKVCFWNPVDIQRTLCGGDLDAIREEAHHQVWAFGNHGGGFMVKAYEQPNAIGLAPEAMDAQVEAFTSHADYPLKPYPAAG